MHLRLLVELDSAGESSDAAYLTVGTRRFDLINYSTRAAEDSDFAVPEYTCVSYIWGRGRLQHPTNVNMEISTNTLPALLAAVRLSPQGSRNNHFWIDAFCIPHEVDDESITARRRTLESMGYVYSVAKQVVVALSYQTFGVVKRMAGDLDTPATEEELRVLEQDEWVSSVWTYQELVNCNLVIFVPVADDDGGEVVSISGGDFLNVFSMSLHSFAEARSLTSFDMYTPQYFPRLSALEDAVLDWQFSEYVGRSALQVMSAMDRRVCVKLKNRLYSMIGAVSAEPSVRGAQPVIEELCKGFISHCVEKGDYSFIYSREKREEADENGTRRAWMPKMGLLEAVFSWHLSGELQLGRVDEQGRLWLEDSVELPLSDEIGSEELKAIQCGPLRNIVHEGDSVEQTVTLIRDAIVKAGFTGTGEAFLTPDGVFYPQWECELPKSSQSTIILGSLTWPFGAPALLARRTQEDVEYIPGVYIGVLDKGERKAVIL